MSFIIYTSIVVAALAFGVMFSQKVKDWAKGIPSVVRADLSKVEAAAVAKLKGGVPSVLAVPSVIAPVPSKPLTP